VTAIHRIAAATLVLAGIISAIWLVTGPFTLHETVIHDPPLVGVGSGVGPEELDIYIECKSDGPLVVEEPGGFAVVYNSSTWTPRTTDTQQLCDDATDTRRDAALAVGVVSLVMAIGVIVHGQIRRRRRQQSDNDLPDLTPTALAPDDEVASTAGGWTEADIQPRVPGLDR
jgi:hypothetical protein